MVSNAKFEVEKFDETNNFGMWQCKVMDVLVQQELNIALDDKTAELSDKDWEKINRQACSTIRLYLTKDQKYFVWYLRVYLAYLVVAWNDLHFVFGWAQI